MKSLYLIDCDGTLLDDTLDLVWEMYWASGKNSLTYTVEKYMRFQNVDNLKINTQLIEELKLIDRTKYDIFLFTNRPEKFRPATLRNLKEHLNLFDNYIFSGGGKEKQVPILKERYKKVIVYDNHQKYVDLGDKKKSKLITKDWQENKTNGELNA